MADVPSPSGSNFTPYQRQLLQQARAWLNPKKDSIVGVLIADDGRQFPLDSGGGQGFSSHIEGKATKKMVELRIKRATLIVELEPCQLCDRSDYPAATGPEAPLKSTATGKELTRQTAKINSALPIDYELEVVGPESTGIYRGTKSVSAKPAPRGPGDPIVEPGTPPSSGSKRAPIVSSRLRFAAVPMRAAVDIVLSLILDVIAAKFNQYLDQKHFEREFLALQPKINEKKHEAYFAFMRWYGSQKLGSLYYNIKLKVDAMTIIVIAAEHSRNIPLLGLDVLSVVITNADINTAGHVYEKIETAEEKFGASHPVMYYTLTQFPTYSEPVEAL